MRRIFVVALAMVGLPWLGCAGSKQETRAEAVPAPGPEAQAPRTHGPKKRIGIVEFMNSSNAHGWGSGRDALADAAREACTEALVNSGAFVVVEREQLQHIMAEQGLGQTGAISAQSAAQAGKLLGLQAIVTGKVLDFAEENRASGFGGYYASQTRIAKARVSLRVTDVTTGEVWIAESGQGQADEKSVQVMGGGNHAHDQNLGKAALYAAINQVMGKLVTKADSRPWEGSVAKVSRDGKVYITAGSDIGLPVGAALEVRRPGEEITDPTSGQVIGREPGKVLGILTLASHLNEKLSVCDTAQGQGFVVGDHVNLRLAAQ